MGKLYDNRNIVEQGQHYINHVSAMTGEGLHSKSAIAAELAHRDIQIEHQSAEIERLQATGQIQRNLEAQLQGEVNNLEADNAALRQKVAELESLLREAVQDISDWGSYASEYFQEKHDLAGTIAKYEVALSELKEQS